MDNDITFPYFYTLKYIHTSWSSVPSCLPLINLKCDQIWKISLATASQIPTTEGPKPGRGEW